MKKGIFIFLLFIGSIITRSQEIEPSLDQLISMDFDSLMSIGVQTYSKTSEQLNEIPAAVYVFTQDDIERSGATRLHEILIHAPGLWVSEMTYSQNKFSSRTELEEYFQGISFLIDGVRVINHLTSGFPFNLFDYPLQNIEKIEIIRGSGGIIYGANANTGVINIITKKATDKNNKLISINAGTRSFINPYLSYSLSKGKNNIKVFGEFKSREAYRLHDYYFQNDSLKQFIKPYEDNRIDYFESIALGLTHQYKHSKKLDNDLHIYLNQIYTPAVSNSINNPVTINNNGGKSLNIINKTNLHRSDSNNAFLRAHYNIQDNNTALRGSYRYKISSLNFDLQDNIVSKKHNLIFGINFNLVAFNLQKPSQKSDLDFNRHNFSEELYAIYIQDNYKLSNDVSITLGGKLETWTLVSDKPNFLPTARIMFLPSRQNSFWGSYTNTYTTPGLTQTEVEFKLLKYPEELTPNTYGALLPGDEVKPVVHHTFELGFRSKLIPNSTFEITTYYNRVLGYLNTAEANDPTDPSTWTPTTSKVDPSKTLIPIYYYSNVANMNDYGGEIILKSKLMNNLLLESSYSFFNREVNPLDDPNNDGEKYITTSNVLMPKHIIRFRPYLDFPKIGVRTSLWTNIYWDRDSSHPENKPNQFKLNFTIEKHLLNNSLIISLWGKDITNNTPYIEEHTNFLPLEYKHAIHSMYGLKISYNFDK